MLQRKLNNKTITIYNVRVERLTKDTICHTEQQSASTGVEVFLCYVPLYKSLKAF